MKKLCGLLFLSLYSCGIIYDAETRLVSEFHVMDADGAPLAGKQIETWVNAGSYTEMISAGTTDANGNLTLIFPAPEDKEAVFTFQVSGYPAHGNRRFENIFRKDFEAYRFSNENLGLFLSGQTVQLIVTFSQITPGVQLKSAWIDNPAASYTYINPPERDYEKPDSMGFTVAKNSTAILRYVIANSVTDTEEQLSVEIPIGIDSVDYTLTF